MRIIFLFYFLWLKDFRFRNYKSHLSSVLCTGQRSEKPYRSVLTILAWLCSRRRFVLNWPLLKGFERLRISIWVNLVVCMLLGLGICMSFGMRGGSEQELVWCNLRDWCHCFFWKCMPQMISRDLPRIVGRKVLLLLVLLFFIYITFREAVLMGWLGESVTFLETSCLNHT